VLVGIPGAGKSTFADALVASGRGFRRVCQDEMGSRHAVESAIEALAKEKGVRIVVDRCNVEPGDRERWLRLTALPTGCRAACVHLVARPAECERRVAARTNHPTIRHGDGRVAVRHMAKRLVVPCAEEAFDDIVVVSTFDETNALLRRWGAAPPTAAVSTARLGGWDVPSDAVRLSIVDGATHRGKKGRGSGPAAAGGLVMCERSYESIVAAVVGRLRLAPKERTRLRLTVAGSSETLTLEACSHLGAEVSVIASLTPHADTALSSVDAASPTVSARSAPNVEAASEMVAPSRNATAHGKPTALRTARDVIDRILWDPSYSAAHASVGYIDRLCDGGVAERRLLDMEWDADLAAVGPHVLAIPEHRISYIAYNDKVVWDKATRHDGIFAAACVLAGSET